MSLKAKTLKITNGLGRDVGTGECFGHRFCKVVVFKLYPSAMLASCGLKVPAASLQIERSHIKRTDYNLLGQARQVGAQIRKANCKPCTLLSPHYSACLAGLPTLTGEIPRDLFSNLMTCWKFLEALLQFSGLLLVATWRRFLETQAIMDIWQPECLLMEPAAPIRKCFHSACDS